MAEETHCEAGMHARGQGISRLLVFLDGIIDTLVLASGSLMPLKGVDKGGASESVAYVLALVEASRGHDRLRAHRRALAAEAEAGSRDKEDEEDEEDADAEEGSDCVVCWANEAVVALTPCGHVCLCPHCSGLSICPMCRSQVVGTLRVYFDDGY
jgi:hypothetical protein